eukprot:1051902-Prymnesium_polylepis.1
MLRALQDAAATVTTPVSSDWFPASQSLLTKEGWFPEDGVPAGRPAAPREAQFSIAGEDESVAAG